MKVEIVVPEVGESITEGVIVEWFKATGDHVAKDEPLFELETDKITQQVLAQNAGQLSIGVESGDVNIGQVVGSIDTASAGATASALEPLSAETVDLTEAPTVAVGPVGDPPRGPAVDRPLSPAVRRLVDEHELDVSGLEGSGKDGRLTKGDVLAALQRSETRPLASPATARPGLSEEQTAPGGQPLPTMGSEGLTEQPTRLALPSNLRAAGVEQTLAPAKTAIAPEYLIGGKASAQGGHSGKPKQGIAPIPSGSYSVQAREDLPPPPILHGPAPAILDADQGDEALPAVARETRKPMSSLRRRLAQRLVDVQQTAAILTTFNEADMSGVMALREQHKKHFADKHGVKLGFMSFFVKAVVDALKTVPAVNARIDGDHVVQNHFYDIGVAVGTEKGLVVPVLRNVHRMGFAEVELTINDFAKRARERRLGLDEMTGGCFTISNGGVYGSLVSTPILNPPQSAILGMHAIKKRPMVVGPDDRIEARPMMYLALSYDHRLIDGAEAVTFLKRIVECIEAPERMLLQI
jgi:2-oxoglutarate dehydrogenase E2 component (dihydrolipoamide succinyltransferase)